MFGLAADRVTWLKEPAQRRAVLLSNLGIFALMWAVTYASTVWGTSEVLKYYMIPWFCVNEWFVFITYVRITSFYLQSLWT